MCGICGKLNFDQEAVVSRALLRAMLNTIRHRGPDDEGIYTSGHVGLGHRRLSIIGLSTGHQPLSNEDGTVWITFNGEIYNYQDLRHELIANGHIFATTTDTEVIVHLYEEYGEGCVERLRGMFAFAIWDDRQQTLLLARDRVGIKPLYYHLTSDALTFASEIKALLADPDVEPEILPRMIDRFLTFYYVPGEETLLRNIYKLTPGSYMVVKGGKPQIRQYWDLDFTPRDLSLKDAERQLLQLLDEAVQSHMMSDVPVGFLLSGGVDSTAMLSLAAGHTDQPLSSFTVGFSEPGIVDERPYARLAARTYGSEHHEITISSQDFRDFLPRYVWHMEEPVCEPPAIALYYVSRLAKEYVKVLISGEGGDEAFAGYPNYLSFLWLERLKGALGPLSRAISISVCAGSRMLPVKVRRYAALLGTTFESYYYSRSSSPCNFFNARSSDLYAPEFVDYVSKEFSICGVRQHLFRAADNGRLSQMLYSDAKTWLPDDLLLKADKMTMANSVELRVPFLDHRVLEFAAALPDRYKIRGLTAKFVAKRALRSRVPREILQRKKAGFPVPYEGWLRADLKDWLVDILLDSTTLARGYFNKKCIEHLVSQQTLSACYSKELFSLAALELWHRAFGVKDNALMAEAPINASTVDHTLSTR